MGLRSRSKVPSVMDNRTGYMHPQYVHSLSEFGVPCKLSLCGGWILERPIPGFPYRDAMGPYPLFVCQDWSKLRADCAEVGKELVSLSIVTDPFGEYDLTRLHKCFDVVIPFKDHFVADLSQPIETIVSKSHRSTVRRAMRNVDVERCAEPLLFLEEWVELFANLVKKHNITGIRAFSRTAFAEQLDIPGVVLFRAVSQGSTIGLDLWYVHGEVAYGHLVGITPLGYKLRASYAMKWYLIQYFADKVRWLDLGGGAGVESGNADGLTDFKRGWSTGSRTAYFCGRIFNHEIYFEIVKAKGITATDYFPAYRKGEFG
jgi:hypothetical protein